MGQRQASPCVRLARRCIGGLWRKGDSAMDAEEQDFLGIPSGKDALTASSPLDTSAKRLADGTVSRRQALKLMGAGAAAASLILAGCGGGKDRAKGSASGSTSGAAESVVLRLGRPAGVPARKGPGDSRLGDAREGGQGGTQRWTDGLRRDRRRAHTGPPASTLTQTPPTSLTAPTSWAARKARGIVGSGRSVHGPGRLPRPFLSDAPIHRSAWKGHSANFALTAFSEVRPLAQIREIAGADISARRQPARSAAGHRTRAGS
jgi:hypothetical protein